MNECNQKLGHITGLGGAQCRDREMAYVGLVNVFVERPCWPTVRSFTVMIMGAASSEIRHGPRM